jgi:hypothetical protein
MIKQMKALKRKTHPSMHKGLCDASNFHYRSSSNKHILNDYARNQSQIEHNMY